jgi:hypothetical protein
MANPVNFPGSNHTFGPPPVQDTVGDVIVTHHAPDKQGVPLDYFQNPKLWTQKSAMYSVLGPFVEAIEPLAWIHGHTHIRKDYTVYGANVHTAAVDSVGVVIDLSGYTYKPRNYN